MVDPCSSYVYLFAGVCLGMQCAVIEFARHILHLEGANSTEAVTNTKYPVVSSMPFTTLCNIFVSCALKFIFYPHPHALTVY